MRREKLASQLARQARLPAAAARDQVDVLVHKILKSLREGKPVEFPGMGRLVSAPAKVPPAAKLAGPARRSSATLKRMPQ